jgi:RimJ/RimL family protein N-acetyltransferase
MKNNKPILTMDNLKNITLRKFEQSDSSLLFTYLNDEKVTQYITSAIPQPYTKEDVQWWLNVGSKVEHIRAIELNGTLVGCISATVGSFEYNRSAELGYWLGRDYWNQGIATNAVAQFSEALFKSTDIVRLFVSVVAENKASIRVLENNGFTHDALLEKASFKQGKYFNECLLSKISLDFD